MIKVVTEASSKVMGENQRDGYIRTKLHAQREMPSFTSKKVHLKILDFSLYTMKLLIYFKKYKNKFENLMPFSFSGFANFFQNHFYQ